MITALWAALAMVVQDVFGTLLVQAQARNRAQLSAILDTVGYGASLICTYIGVSALQSHDLALKVTVIAAVSVANYGGTWAGVSIGERYIKGGRNAGTFRHH